MKKFSRNSFRIALLSGLLLTVIIIGGHLAKAQVGPEPEEMMAYREAFVIAVEGTVEIKPAGQPEWVPAEVGMELKQGDEIRTGAFSEIEIAFEEEEENIIRIDEEAELTLRELTTDMITGGESTSLGLDLGGVLARLEELPEESEFEVRTPTAVAGVRGTGFRVELVELSPELRTIVTVFDGEVGVKGIDELGRPFGPEIRVTENRRTEVEPYQVPSMPRRAKREDRKEWKVWEEEKEERIEEIREKIRPRLSDIFICNRDAEEIEDVLYLIKRDLIAGRIEIKGMAESEVSQIDRVEVSLDGGASWRSAEGRESWRFGFRPEPEREYEIQIRAIDKLGTPSDIASFKVGYAFPTPPPELVDIFICKQDIWDIVGTLSLSRDDLVDARVEVRGMAESEVSRIEKVEVSTDDGESWRLAEGKESWRFSFRPEEDITYTILARATDGLGVMSEVDRFRPVEVVYSAITDEDLIRELVRKFALAYEEEDLTGLMALFCEDRYGDYYVTEDSFRDEFSRCTDFSLDLTITSLSISGLRAEGRVHYEHKTTCDSTTESDAGDVTMKLEKIGGEWLIVDIPEKPWFEEENQPPTIAWGPYESKPSDWSPYAGEEPYCIRVDVSDPDGLSDISSVKWEYSASITGDSGYLYDTGYPDECSPSDEAGDGRYTHLIGFPYSGSYTMTVTVRDSAGHEATVTDTFTVKEIQ